MIPQRRLTSRIAMGPEHTLRFTAGGHAFQGIRMVNLSEGGCFLTVPRSDAGIFRAGVLLELLRFEGPGLPQDPLTGKVAFAMGASPGMPMLGVGVNFLHTPDAVLSALRRFIGAAQGRSQG